MFRSQTLQKYATRCSGKGKSMLEKVGENLSQAAKQEGAKGLDKMVSEKITLFGVGSGIFTLFCVFQGANLLLFNRFYLKKHIDTMN